MMLDIHQARREERLSFIHDQQSVMEKNATGVPIICKIDIRTKHFYFKDRGNESGLRTSSQWNRKHKG